MWLGRSQRSNANLIGTRVGIIVARTIRRLPTSEREDSHLVVTMLGTPVAGRPADAAADDAPIVTRHAVERKEVIVVAAISGAPQQAGSGESGSAPSNPVPNLSKADSREGTTIIGCSGKQPSFKWRERERVDSSGLGGDVPMEVAQAVEPTTKSHAPVEEHDESLVPKRRRGRPATHCWPSPRSPRYTVGCPGCDGRSCRHLTKCQQKRIELGLSASSRSRDVLGDVVMNEVPHHWKRCHRLLHLLNRHLC